MIDFGKFVEWAFLGVVGGGVYILWQMKESIAHLNGKIDVILEKHNQAREDIDDHEARLRGLERRA